MTADVREIAERAYARWASNGYPPGTALDDWVAAGTEFASPGSLASPPEGPPLPEDPLLLRALLENSTAVIYAKDTRGRYILVNARFEALFGTGRARVVGQTDHDLFPPDQAAAFRANDLDVLTTGRPREFEELVRQEDGPHTYLSLKFPVATPDGLPLAVCGISTDITERKRMQRCLEAQHAVTRALAASAKFLDASPHILRAVCESLGWDVGLVWLVDPVTQLLGCVDVWHGPADGFPDFVRSSRHLALPAGVGLPGRVLATGESVWIPDMVAARLPRAPAALQDGLHAACGFPIRNGGEILGVIEFCSREVRRPDLDLARVLDGIGSQLNQFIERRRAERVLHKREREFEVAHEIQCSLLPRAAPVVPGFAVGGGSYPAQETGGDYFDFIPLADGSVGIVIGDASGHGIGAALVIAQTRAFLRAWATTGADVGTVLTRVNRQLSEDLPDGHFVTLFFARLDVASRWLSYGSAGHWPGYVLDGRGDVRVLLESTGLPLGIDPNADFPGGPAVHLESGDLVLLVTDGIVETHTREGTVFGVERVLDCVRGSRDRTPDEIVTALRRAGRRFSDHQTDDVTAVVIKVE